MHTPSSSQQQLLQQHQFEEQLNDASATKNAKLCQDSYLSSSSNQTTEEEDTSDEDEDDGGSGDESGADDNNEELGYLQYMAHESQVQSKTEHPEEVVDRLTTHPTSKENVPQKTQRKAIGKTQSLKHSKHPKDSEKELGLKMKVDEWAQQQEQKMQQWEQQQKVQVRLWKHQAKSEVKIARMASENDKLKAELQVLNGRALG